LHLLTKDDADWVKHLVTIFHIRPSTIPSFLVMLNVELNTRFNPKDKVTSEFSIILSLTLVVASDAEFHMKHQTKLEHHSEVDLNNPA